MPAKKYDRDKIKLEFMDSDFKEVAPFLKRKLGEKSEYSLTVTVKDEGELEMLKKDLNELGYTNYK